MSLKLRTTTTFKTTIDVTFASGETGDFVGEFKYLTRAQLDELLARQLPDGEFVEQVLLATSGISADGGGEVDLSTAVTAIKEDIALSSATVRGYLSALGGAPAKNSRTSRAR